MINDIPYYVELQRRMFDIFRYVSCHEKNFQTHSVMLESLFVGAASFFDSQCQTFIRESSLAKHQFHNEAEVTNFQQKVVGTDNFNCGDYRVLLESTFKLSDYAVILNPYEEALLLNPMIYTPHDLTGYRVFPFKEWASGKALPWWCTFTDLKHNRLKHHNEATLLNTILALAAAYVILALHNVRAFKEGRVDVELYDLFLPQFWKRRGSATIMRPIWN